MNKKILFPELVDRLAEATSTSKRVCEIFLKELFATISQELSSGKSVKVKHLGVFKLTTVGARRSRDVNSGDEIHIPEHSKLTFVPDDNLAEEINAPFSTFETILIDDNISDEALNAVGDSPVADLDESETKLDEQRAYSDVSEESYVSNEETIDVADDDRKEIVEEEKTETTVIVPPPFFAPKEESEGVASGDDVLQSESELNENEMLHQPEAAVESAPGVAALITPPPFVSEPVAEAQQGTPIIDNSVDSEDKTAVDDGFAEEEPKTEAEPVEVADDNGIEDCTLPEGESENDVEQNERNVVAESGMAPLVATDSAETPDIEKDDKGTENNEYVESIENEPNQEMENDNELEERDDTERTVYPVDYRLQEMRENCSAKLRKTFIFGFLCGVVAVLAIGAIVWNVKSSRLMSEAEPAVLVDAEQADVVEENVDSAGNKIESEQPQALVKDVEKEQPEAAAQAESKPVSNKVVLDTITPTKFLTRLGAKYYGKSCFWVYIYEENKDKIGDPDNVKPGTVVVIPPKEKYGINKDDKASVEAAKKKQSEIWNRKK